MTERAVDLKVILGAGAGVEAEEVEELTLQLRERLLELDVIDVERERADDPPDGARPGDVVSIGALIVSIVGSSGLLSAVVNAIQSWMIGLGPRSVKLDLDGDVLEVTGIDSREQRRLIQVWLDRHRDQ
jgi:hypothetical protein